VLNLVDQEKETLVILKIKSMWKTICTRFRNQVEIGFIKTFLNFIYSLVKFFPKTFWLKTPFSTRKAKKIKRNLFKKSFLNISKAH